MSPWVAFFLGMLVGVLVYLIGVLAARFIMWRG